MEDNTTHSVFGIDLGDFFGGIAQQVAKKKGFDSPEAYIQGTAADALNKARLTREAGQDTKQTPAVIQPGAWSQQISKALPFQLNLSNSQLAIGAVILVGAIVLLARR